MKIEIEGRARRLGDDIHTDAIIRSSRKKDTLDPEALKRYLLESVDPDFAASVVPGDVLVAGKNFGLGSSREHAPTVIKMAGVSAVLAKSVARIFFRNAINVGLPVLITDTDKIKDGDELEVDLASGTIKDVTNGAKIGFNPLPEVMLNILDEGGLIPYINKHKGFDVKPAATAKGRK